MAAVNGSQSHRKCGWAKLQEKFEDLEHSSLSIAALRLAGSDIRRSLASHHIAGLPWQYSAPLFIMLTAVCAGWA
jgi:hypothetical protein